MIWKDRIKQYPHRYTLTNVSGSTYDFTEVTGDVTEAGTPVNAENLNKLIQRDGDDIKDTVTTFTEASTRANIATGEKTSTIFGKIKKWFADLKAHAFANPSTAQGTGITTVPSDLLLTQSSYARRYISLTDLGLTSTANPEEVGAAMIDNSIVELDVTSSNAPNIVPSYVGGQCCIVTFKRKTANVISGILQTKTANTTNNFMLYGSIRVNDTSNKWSGWKQVFTTDNISTTYPLNQAASSLTKVLSERTAFDKIETLSPKANPTFTGTVTVPDATVSGAAVNKGQMDLKANDNAVVKLTTDQTIAGIKTFSSSPIVPNGESPYAAVNALQLATAAEASNPFLRSWASGTSGSLTLTEYGSYQFRRGTNINGVIVNRWTNSSDFYSAITINPANPQYQYFIKINKTGVVEMGRHNADDGTVTYDSLNTIEYRKLD